MDVEEVKKRLEDPRRLRLLRDTGLLDSPPEEAFDRLTRLACRLLNTSTALMTLVDDHRQFFKSAIGVGEPWASRRETPLSHSFCKNAVAESIPFVVQDARDDLRVRENGAVRDLGVVAYLGVPVLGLEQQPMGALCVIDGQPRQWSRSDIETLQDLAAAASAEVRLRNSQRALDRSQQIYAALVGQLPRTSVTLFDQDLRIFFAEGGVLKALGLQKEKLVGRVMEEVAHPDTAAIMMPNYRASLQGKSSQAVLMRGDRQLEINVRPMRDLDGVIIAGLVMTYDITDMARTEAALREKTELLQLMLASIDDVVMVVDAKARLVLANDAAERLFGGALRAEGWSPANQTFLADGETHCPLPALPLQQALVGAKVRQMELFVRPLEAPRDAPSGVDPGRWLSINAAPLHAADGSITGAVSVSRDITAVREASMELLEQSRRVSLLQKVAVAANLSPGVEQVLRETLQTIIDDTGWPLAHVYLPHGGHMAPSELWVSPELERFQPMVEATMNLDFAAGEGLIGHVAKTGRLLWVGDLMAEQRFQRQAAAATAGLSQGVFIPLLVGPQVVGVVELFIAGRRPPEPRFIELLENVGAMVGRVFEREQARHKLTAYAAEVEALSLVDELTGLYNRRGFLTLAEQQMRAGQRSRLQHCLIFGDLDGMKAINDQLGHHNGDHALRDTALLLRKTFRDSDITARLGGDEFVAFAADTDRRVGELIIERFQQKLEQHNRRGERPFQLRVSLGLTVSDPADPRSVEELVVAADKLMYLEKRKRRG